MHCISDKAVEIP